MVKKTIKSVVGIYPDGSKQSFSLDNLEEMRLQEFIGVEIVEEITKEQLKELLLKKQYEQ